MNYSQIALISLLTLLVGACSQQPAPSKTVMETVTKKETVAASTLSQGYRKPGAAIRFSSDYSGSSVPGQVDRVELSFTAQVDGVLTVRIRAKEGGFDPTDQDIFDMFNLVVLNFAYSACKDRKIKKLVKKSTGQNFSSSK